MNLNNIDEVKIKTDHILNKDFDRNFYLMILSILEESQDLAHELKLPNIGRTFQEKFSALV